MMATNAPITNGQQRVPMREQLPPDPRAGEFWLCNRQLDRWKDSKQLATKVAEEDPLLVFLRRINGKVMWPVLHRPAAIEAECQDVTPERQGTKAVHQDDALP
jgi:hypothetical protein